jgi:hypothetical protein
LVESIATILAALLVVGIFLSLFWPWCMWLSYRRLCGIERALWAVGTQLQKTREEERSLPVSLVEKAVAEALRAPRPISSSMFGR